MPPLHSIIENILKDTRKAKHIIYKQGQRFIAKTLHVGTPTNTQVKGIPLKYRITDIMQHFLQQPLELNGEKLMFSTQLSDDIILLDNHDNKICDRAVVFTQVGFDDLSSFLLVVAFEKTDIHIDYKRLICNIYDDLKSKNIIQIYDLNAVPPEEPLKQHFMYTHDTHVVFSRHKLDYINQGSPYRTQLEDCCQQNQLLCEVPNREGEVRLRIPFTIQVFVSPLMPQFEWILQYIAELQKLYTFYYICVCIKGVDQQQLDIVLKRCPCAASLNIVCETRGETIVDEMLEVPTDQQGKGPKVAKIPFVANIILMYPQKYVDGYPVEGIYEQPQVIDVAMSIDELHEAIVQQQQQPIITMERQRFFEARDKNPDDIQRIEQYCAEDSYYRRHLIKPVEFVEDGEPDQEGNQNYNLMFYGVQLKMYCQGAYGVPKKDDWAIVAFINPNLSNVDKILLDLDTLQSYASDQYKTKINISVVVESSWSKNIKSIMDNPNLTMLRHFNVILDGCNIFRIAGDMIGSKPPYYFLFGPHMRLLDTATSFDSFGSLLYSFNEEQAMERQNRTKPISTDPDPDHSISSINENNCIKFTYSGCTGCNACVSACQYGILINANEKNNPPFVVKRDGKTDGNDKINRIKLDDSHCIGCGQCTLFCKVGEVLTPVSHLERLTKALASNGKTQVAIISPAARAAITTAMRIGGSGQQKLATRQLIAALRDMGFAVIVDGVFGADMAIQMDIQEIELNQSVRPVISSTCPAAVQLISSKYPQYKEYLSPSKSPVEMTACAVRSQMFASKGVEVEISSITTCVADKNLKEIDHVITVFELMNYLQQKNEQFSFEREIKLEQENIVQFDNPWHNCSFIGNSFGYIGGQSSAVGNVMCLNKGEKDFKLDTVKTINVDMDPKGSTITISSFNRQGTVFKIATVANGRAIDYLMQQFIAKNPDFTSLNYVEIMACDFGCVDGGGCTKKDANEIQRLVAQSSLSRAQLLLPESQRLIKGELKYQNQVIQDLYSLVSKDRFIKSMQRGQHWAKADPSSGIGDQPEVEEVNTAPEQQTPEV